MTQHPLVSVIIPAYNIAPYIAEALESVLAQSYPAYEVILVNDGSPDSAALEQAIAPYSGRIHYLTQPNAGAAAARNTAIRASRGELLAFLDGDDRWEPNLLAAQVDFLRQGPYDLVFANARLVGEVEHPGLTYMDVSPSTGTPGLAALLNNTCQPLTSTTLVRRQAVLTAGLFDETLRRAQDFELWVRLALSGARIGYQRAVLAAYRVRADGLSGVDELGRIDREVVVYQTLRDKLALPPAAAALVEKKLRRLHAARELARGKAALAAGRFAQAEELFGSAWRERASLKLLGVRLALAVSPGTLRRLYARARGP